MKYGLISRIAFKALLDLDKADVTCGPHFSLESKTIPRTLISGLVKRVLPKTKRCALIHI